MGDWNWRRCGWHGGKGWTTRTGSGTREPGGVAPVVVIVVVVIVGGGGGGECCGAGEEEWCEVHGCCLFLRFWACGMMVDGW